MRTLVRYASSARQPSLTSVTGPLTVTMSDGTTYNFAPATADRVGQIYARAGSTFQRVTGPLDTCQDSYTGN